MPTKTLVARMGVKDIDRHSCFFLLYPDDGGHTTFGNIRLSRTLRKGLIMVCEIQCHTLAALPGRM